jgi:selenobiotic family peptide radical SAM maturase
MMKIDCYKVNSSVELVKLMDGEFEIRWKHPSSGKVVAKCAESWELLALKVCTEGLSAEDIAQETGTDPGIVRNALISAAQSGIIIAPRSRLERGRDFMKDLSCIPEEYTSCDVFTLQWHITHMCDLHCRHCYDRAKRGHLSLEKSINVLEELDAFCEEKFVRGHVCFTGGNPLLYPHFFEIYEAVSRRGFSTSILGNPVSREKVKKIIKIQIPEYFQVSLEGLEEHNDHIRGKGSFESVMRFLEVLKDEGISSAVMLTLTTDNIDQVIPLANFLRKSTDYFTFNRLSPVGEGARLELPSKKRYMDFLSEYLDASRSNSIMGFKDNLINVVLKKNGEELFGGCTGHGCGAAFNFLTLLPDGEVHACRKFPSPVGNINSEGIMEIYDSDEAEKYRKGTKGCYSCGMKHVCGGCLAVASGCGEDIFEEKDPYCFNRDERG